MENNKFAEKIREAASEGAVLIKNENNVLPFTDSDTVSIFGRAQIDYYKSGTGSGGSVHVLYSTNLLDGMLRKKSSGHNPLINKELARVYTDWIKQNPFDNGGGGWAAEPWCQKEMEVSSELATNSASVSTKAVYVVGRTAGEEQDNKMEEGSFLLTKTEREALIKICGAFEKVVVVLNVSNIIDMSWVESPEFNGHISSVIYTWHGGMEGGNAAADVLCGVTSPSGKLTDTIAHSIEDYPSTANFGGAEKNIYAEDIYVGYRYFETFVPEKIQYPFGYGLSYASFEVDFIKANDKKGIINVTVDVKNTSKDFSGKEVVQLYFEAPQGKLGKPTRALCAFAKTKLLAPKEKEKITLSFPLSSMASYDDSGATGNKNCFVLEAGEYRFYLGTDSHSAKQILIDEKNSVNVISTLVVEKLEQAAAPSEAFKRMKPMSKKADGTYALGYENVPLSEIDLSKRIKENLPKEISYTGDVGIKFKDVQKKPAKLDPFIAQLNAEELATLVRGEGMCSDKVTPGIAAAFGGLSEALYNYGIPVAGVSDGPSGIRMDNGKEASLMPIGTLLACTWNTELVSELYICEGKELASNQIDSLLGPGMNIHRNPLNGRNFEYYSEDPLVTGAMASAVVYGLRHGGASGTIKHFATNNQETKRHIVNAIVSERALREIYLRGFERAVKQGKANSIMTTYTPLNGHWTGSNYDLVNTILHKEWDFTGLVMTDWWAELNDCVEGGAQSIKNTASMVRARNDVYMVVDNNGASSNVYGDNIPSMLKEGKLTLAELQVCAKDVINFLMQCPVSKRKLRPLKQVELCKTNVKSEPKVEKIYSVSERFSPSNDSKKSEWIKIESDGAYNVFATYTKSTDKLVSQSVCNILFNGSPYVSFDSRGTNCNILTTNVGRIKLEQGYYEISLNNIKPGIEVQNVFFQKTGN
ncbi:MAG: glycoside hydrolase family 3 C-terminal domain-containing protein [Treponema sp.]